MDKAKIKRLLAKQIQEDQIFIDEPMSKHTSFKIGGTADVFIKVKNIQELKYVIKVAKKVDTHLTIIGNGSNVLVKDNGIRGIVLKIQFEEISIQRNVLGQPNKEDVIVTVGSGVKLGELAQKLLKEGITGFEFASGIPGTIGGAIRMNAGAYGGEMKDIVIETKCLDLECYERLIEKTNIDDIEIIIETESKKTPEIIILNNKEQDFAYRHSVFMERKYIILEVKLQLKRGNVQEIKDKMEQFLASRNEKQPVQMPSAGSTFKRGTDYITARLIDECGLKGCRVGGAKVSEKHAGFIVNEKNATAKDVIELIKQVQDTVYAKTGKKIELEIEILGE